MRPALLWIALAACSGTPAPGPEPEPEATPAPAPETVLPTFEWRLPGREATTPVPFASTPELEATRALLVRVVQAYAPDPANPWAVSHALVALGPDVTLSNGEPAVDWLFAEYAETFRIGDETLVRFPRRRGDIRIEPHTDLVLKALTEIGVSPDRPVVVQGTPSTVAALYRGSLVRTWVEGDEVSAEGWNDVPWTLQGLATWAPAGLAWTSEGHAMTLDGATHAVVDRLAKECAFIRDALASGGTFEKRGQGIFGYTCGGAHLIQGAAYAVARGFGSDADRETVRAQIPGLYARLDVELTQVDAALRQHPDYAVVLLVQRLKFLGHFLESTHKMAAMGLYEPDPAQRAALDRAVGELVATVAVLNQIQVFDKMEAVRAADEQIYLDLVGDSAHAIRGIDLATGKAAIRY